MTINTKAQSVRFLQAILLGVKQETYSDSKRHEIDVDLDSGVIFVTDRATRAKTIVPLTNIAFIVEQPLEQPVAVAEAKVVGKAKA